MDIEIEFESDLVCDVVIDVLQEDGFITISVTVTESDDQDVG